jgi:hypothetical protein
LALPEQLDAAMAMPRATGPPPGQLGDGLARNTLADRLGSSVDVVEISGFHCVNAVSFEFHSKITP